MQTGQQGRCALALSIRSLMRAAGRCFPALVLAVMCLGVVSPAHAAAKAHVEKTHVQKAYKRAAIKPLAHPPGEALAREMFKHNRPSLKHLDVLMPLTGTWDYLAVLWTQPNAKPLHAVGTATNEMALDTHYLSSKATGSLSVDGQMMPMEGQELIGYDTARKSFSSVWVDTLTTGMMTGRGRYNPQKHVLYETGHFTNPLTGAAQRFLSELKFVDASHYTRTIFAIGRSGKKTKLMEFDYTRRNSPSRPAKK